MSPAAFATADGSSMKQPRRQRQPQPPSVLPSCILCYSVEMTMMDLFSPVGVELERTASILSDTYRNAESKDDDDDDEHDDDSDYYEWSDGDDDDDSSDGSSVATDLNTSQDSSVARKICQLWKKKRKQVKAKTLRLRQEAHKPKELNQRSSTAKSTSTAKTKTFTMATQRVVRKHSAVPFDEQEELPSNLVGKFDRAVSIGRERKII